MAQPPSDKNGDVEKYTSLFRKQLQNVELPSKRARLSHTEWADARDKRDKIAHLFLNCGFAVWFAYSRTKRNCKGGKHYIGQSADLAAFSEFQKLSESDQKKVAKALSKILVPTVEMNAWKQLAEAVH
tara:strand:- start:6480 stop:6863 length:384 start_codon:yes stop_codon:yes gene_type:complete